MDNKFIKNHIKFMFKYIRILSITILFGNVTIIYATSTNEFENFNYYL